MSQPIEHVAVADRPTWIARWAQGPWARRVRNLALGIGFPIVVGIVWELLASSGVINPILFSSPSRIFAALDPKLASGELVRDLVATLRLAFVGYVVSAVLGLVIGVAMGLWRRVDYVLEPLVIGLYVAPIIALYPLFIIWFGISFTAMVTLVILFTIFPIIVNASLGVRLVDPVLIRSAVAFAASDREVLTKVTLPAALPAIASGLQLAVGRCLTGVVVAELFIGREGIGYSIGIYANFLRMGDVFFGIVLVGLLGVTFTYLMGWVESRLRYENR
jgi:sulfonate transport system permease protein